MYEICLKFDKKVNKGFYNNIPDEQLNEFLDLEKGELTSQLAAFRP
jgi:hypothetical protein